MTDVTKEPSQPERDRALLERCFAHDRSAWDAFVERFARLIYSVVHEHLRQARGASVPDDVDELFHTVFLALYDHNYRKLRQWNARCSLASWVRLVAASVAVDQLRRRRPTTPIDTTGGTVDGTVPDYLVAPERAPIELLVGAERAALVQRALATLAPADREVLTLVYRDDLAPGAVAAALGIKPGALYTRKNRALARLREAFVALDREGAEQLGGEIDPPQPSGRSCTQGATPRAASGR